ncbi:mitochondrial import inner membrane translocase subunit TIM50-A [Drosophila sulfurigaster albostrigata]|uniref:mitochondrial import inner membrane translocase subunit TIM50-A n=1 Tax=Drosophila sulfurigaster albostrigata TaxID=89887 RepID=UPI002D21C065|nr:mitochondrial import inner membrane translocase subunit TIM50-A [Drosophila sulfurigaster albostrigata]
MLNWTAWLRAMQQKAATKFPLPTSQTWCSVSNKLRSYNKREARISEQTSQQLHTEENTKPKQKSTAKSTAKAKPSPILGIYKNSKPKPSRWGYGYSLVVGGLCASVMWAIYEMGKPEQDQLGRSIEDELSGLSLPQQYLQRMWHSLQYYQKMLEEPLPIRLLPDVLQAPYVQPRYTLVLEMKDVLVHPDWTYQTGWRFKKRPGVDHFLKQCSKDFEIVVYTSEQGMTAFPILDALDPNGYIRYRLVRGATQVIDGQHIKNLNRLNRNLRRLIVVDWDRRAVPLHPDNIFAISRWMGNDDDVQLFDLAAFLSLIAEHQMDDVREVLHYYSQFEDPIEQFKENQRKLLELKQEKPDIEVKAKSR